MPAGSCLCKARLPGVRLSNVLPALLLLAACGDPGPPGPEPLAPLAERDGVEGELIQVADFMQPCFADGVVLCLRTRGEGESDWTNLEGPISGFLPEWGTRFLLDVAVDELVDPETGESSVQYSLLEVLEEEPQDPGTVFSLTLHSDYLQGGARLVGGREFDCELHSLCSDLDEALAAGPRFEAWFEHPEDSGEPIVLTFIL